MLEAKATKQTSWKCDVCALCVPHMHVHKVILWLSCDYLRALLQSGMKERYMLITFSHQYSIHNHRQRLLCDLQFSYSRVCLILCSFTSYILWSIHIWSQLKDENQILFAFTGFVRDLL